MRAEFNIVEKNYDNLQKVYFDEDVFARLGIPLKKGMFCSPFRKDKRPTCSIYREESTLKLKYKDWAFHNRSIDALDIMMEIKRCSFFEGVKYLWDLMEGTERIEVSLDTPKRNRIVPYYSYNLKAIPRGWTADDLRFWHSFGIPARTLEKYDVWPVLKVIENNRISYHHGPKVQPAYMYVFSDTIKVYFPLRWKKRFLHADGQVLQGWDQLPSKGEWLVITKSYKDVMLFDRFNIPAIAPQSENTPVKEAVLAEIGNRFDNVVVLFDNDRAGKLALRYYRDYGMNVCIIPKKYDAKDLTDFYKLHGASMTYKLINSAMEHYASA